MPLVEGAHASGRGRPCPRSGPTTPRVKPHRSLPKADGGPHRARTVGHTILYIGAGWPRIAPPLRGRAGGRSGVRVVVRGLRGPGVMVMVIGPSDPSRSSSEQPRARAMRFASSKLRSRSPISIRLIAVCPRPTSRPNSSWEISRNLRSHFTRLPTMRVLVLAVPAPCRDTGAN